jgi:hypothetical protein
MCVCARRNYHNHLCVVRAAQTKKSACMCTARWKNSSPHPVIRKFRGGGVCQSIHIYIKIVKQMRISSTITAIFLKRYLIYQHKVSESAFFSYKNMCAAVSRWRAENCCRAALRVLLGIHFSLSPFNFHVFGRNRGAHAAPTTTNNNCRAGIWRLVVR